MFPQIKLLFLPLLILSLMLPTILAEDFLQVSFVQVQGSVINQTDDTLHLKLVFENTEGVQPSVGYGIALKRDQVIYDITTYGETFTLAEGMNKTVYLNYTIPNYLNGTFDIVAIASNDRGFGLALGYVGSIDISSSKEYVYLDPAKCMMFTGNQPYSILEGIVVSPNETLTLLCELGEYAGSEKTIMAQVETHYRNQFGRVIPAPVHLDPIYRMSADIGIVSFDLPIPSEPQAYDMAFTLVGKDELERASNTIYPHFIVAGESATLQNVLLDKTVYEQGEYAKLQLFWTGSADDFEGADHEPTKLKNTTIAIDLVGMGAQTCSEETLIVDYNKRFLEKNVRYLELPITNDCTVSRVDVEVLEDDRILDSVNYEFDLIVFTPEHRGETDYEERDMDGQDNALFMVMVVVLLLLIASVVFWKTKWIRK